MVKSKKILPKIGKKRVRSQFEFDVYKAIQHELPRGAELTYEDTRLTYTTTKDYIPDFTITKKDGTIIYVEAKGLGRAFDYDSRVKMEMVKLQHPDKDIRIVFMSDRPFRKGGKVRPSDWATKLGYKFSIVTVPKDWFEE